MGRRFANFIASVVQTIWPWALDMWDDWGLQFLVLVSLGLQIFLVVFGGRRRYDPRWITRLTTWASYFLGSYIATFALGKLSVVNIRDPEDPDYNVGLKGLLAPMLLMHLSNPECMNAYSNVDTHLGRRQALSLLLSAVIVFWILIRCWDKASPVSWLYIPLCVAGIIKLMETCWAHCLIEDDTTSVSELKEVERKLKRGSNDDNVSPTAPDFLKHVLIAHKRFDCLKPHRVKWPYHPAYMRNDWSVKFSEHEEFIITEIELGFVYDMIYTRSPILYTKIGLAGKTVSALCLISALCGFSIIFRNAFLLDLYVTYTYALLMGSCIYELYEICVIPFSTWSVVKMHRKLNQKILDFLVAACEKQKRWSNSLDQLNIQDYILRHDFIKAVTIILKNLKQEERLKGLRCTTRATIDLKFKREVLIRMEPLERERSVMPFTNRGVWSMKIFGIPLDSRDNLFVKETEFGKSIIIWHIATEVLWSRTSSLQYNSCSVSRLLSNYMMHLLVCRPYMLSLTTSMITFGYASALLKEYAAPNEMSIQQSFLSTTFPKKKSGKAENGSFVTHNWFVLDEVNELVTGLKKTMPIEEARWGFICSVWVEMLCYAAYHCPQNYHTAALRKGGELITHVWLLLTHQTDKCPSKEPYLPSTSGIDDEC